ncbi:MAG TPA: FAD-dependent monooxygenase [Acidobacteriaceae bacterium]|nr:FAD-dependent monooxygenase [Acidobacteriaceae bacterium]
MILGQAGCDVLIAGGGPAGLAAAIALRQRGADVLLADALRPPIDKPCGEGLMPDSRRDLAQLGVEPEPSQGAEFGGILFADGDASVSAEFPHGIGLGVRRPILHQILLDRAAELGVRMRWNAPVALRDGQRATVGGELCAYRWLVGADGHASRVRGWAGLDAGDLRSRRFGFRAHYHVAPWSPYVEIHWGTRGQVYITPVGPHEICVAAITRHPGVRLSGILRGIPSLRNKLANVATTDAERGALTLTRRLHRVTRGNVALIGDASGSADAITGEGLAMGFRQALLLADSLSACNLDHYEARHADILALPQRMAAMMLLLDRFEWLRGRAIPMLSAHPNHFREMLAVHVGEQPLRTFVLRHGAAFGALLLAPRFS